MTGTDMTPEELHAAIRLEDPRELNPSETTHEYWGINVLQDAYNPDKWCVTSHIGHSEVSSADLEQLIQEIRASAFSKLALKWAFHGAAVGDILVSMPVRISLQPRFNEKMRGRPAPGLPCPDCGAVIKPYGFLTVCRCAMAFPRVNCEL